MSLTAAQIADLTARCLTAHTYGYQIANAQDYASQLGYTGVSKPVKIKEYSPEHLLNLLGTPGMLSAHEPEKAAVAQEPKKAHEPKKVAPKAESAPAVVKAAESAKTEPEKPVVAPAATDEKKSES